MVSRAWRDIFSPMIYLSVDLSAEADIHQGGKTTKLPPEESIRRKGAVMKDLTVCLPSSYARILLSTIRHLQSLTVLRTDAKCTPQNGPAEVRSLLEYNPSLQRLKLDRFQGPTISTTLKEIGQTCHQLKHLSFVQSNISVARLSDTMMDAPQLTSLSIDRCSMDGFGSTVTQPIFPHLEKLEVDNSGNHLPLLVPQSAVETVDDLSTLWLYPKLTTLIIRGQLKKKKNRLPELLIQCPQLTELTLHGSPLLEEVFNSLTNRFDMLTRLDFLEAGLRSLSMCDKILWSCPQLVYFGYPSHGDPSEYLSTAQSGHANAESRVWTCSGLETLKFKQLSWSRRSSWNERVLEQLSTLTELRVFEVGSMSGKEVDEVHQMAQKWPELDRFPCMKSGLPS